MLFLQPVKLKLSIDPKNVSQVGPFVCFCASFCFAITCEKLLPLNDSLILEALRAVSADIANMIIAAKRCGEVDDVAATQSPRTGGCQNLLVDSMTPNFESGFRKCVQVSIRSRRSQLLDFA